MTNVIVVVGQAIVMLGLLITGFGVYAVLRLDGFYTRIVVTSKVEAMGFVTVVIGAILLAGFSLVSMKLLMILLFELLTVSVGAHAIARSAWMSGYRLRTVTVDLLPAATGELAEADDA